MLHPTPRLFALLALLAFPFAFAAAQPAAVTVIDDDFANADPTGSPARPAFWNIQTPTEGDNGIFESNGYLTLFATRNPYSYACLNSALDPRLDFFRRVVTVSVDDFILDHRNVPASEAFFRLSLNSSEKRQSVAPQSLSLRVVPGVAFLGFKTAPLGKTDAENLVGPVRGSACHELFDGKLIGFSLTLDPFAKPGFVTYTLVLRTDGSRGVITKSGPLQLVVADWLSGGPSALLIEARRNIAATAEESYVSASLGRLVVTSVSQP